MGFVFAFCERGRNLFGKRRGFSPTERFTYPFTKGETSTFSLHKRKSCKKKCASVPLERCRLWREKTANSARTPSHTRNCPLGARMLRRLRLFWRVGSSRDLALRAWCLCSMEIPLSPWFYPHRVKQRGLLRLFSYGLHHPLTFCEQNAFCLSINVRRGSEPLRRRISKVRRT